MKVLLVQAGGRPQGNTAHLLDITEEILREESSEAGETVAVDRLDLGRANLQPCTGCRACFDRGEEFCPRRDDLLSIKSRMQVADALVLASPVYVNDVSGTAKTWIDRLGHVCHRPQFAGKTALLLATTGGTPARHAFRTMQVALWTWGYRIAGKSCVTAGALMSLDELPRRVAGKTESTIRAFARDVRKKAWQRPSFLSLVVFRIQQLGWARRPADSVDYLYWKRNGWLDLRRTSWFIPHRASGIKVLAARLVGRIAAAFTS